MGIRLEKDDKKVLVLTMKEQATGESMVAVIVAVSGVAVVAVVVGK